MPLIVIQELAGSIPVGHPKVHLNEKYIMTEEEIEGLVNHEALVYFP